ncbi:MAG: hypothetical protein HUJ22_07080 [Gracilimonas sp.]|uniref:hypothetical protein n=1 Tax=Gracilimonas sp. TaxID=1974203 RepID=UPI0019CB8247|nr:hypothetical protein [Gracilimonas sp.]MBD3616319.1 hypothetical protein [Gracilimonas sp.]
MCNIFKITLAFLLSICSFRAIAQEVNYNGTVQFSSGEYYFAETSRSVYLNNGVNFSYPKLHFSANLSYVFQDSPWISYTSAGGIATGGPQHGIVSEGAGKGRKGRHDSINIPDTASYIQSGFSDPSVSLSYDVFESYNRHTILSVTGVAKVPFANPEMGFGTGAWDLSLGGSAMGWSGSWLWNASVAYWHFGDMEDLNLHDALSYGLGAGRSFSDQKVMILYSISGMSKVIEGTAAPLLTTIGVSYKMGTFTSLMFNAGYGLSESSADYSLGMGWMIHLN